MSASSLINPSLWSIANKMKWLNSIRSEINTLSNSQLTTQPWCKVFSFHAVYRLGSWLNFKSSTAYFDNGSAPYGKVQTRNSSNMKGSMKFPNDEPTVQWLWLGKHLSMHGTKWKLCSIVPPLQAEPIKSSWIELKDVPITRKHEKRGNPKLKEQRKQKQQKTKTKHEQLWSHACWP